MADLSKDGGWKVYDKPPRRGSTKEPYVAIRTDGQIAFNQAAAEMLSPDQKIYPTHVKFAYNRQKNWFAILQADPEDPAAREIRLNQNRYRLMIREVFRDFGVDYEKGSFRYRPFKLDVGVIAIDLNSPVDDISRRRTS